MSFTSDLARFENKTKQKLLVVPRKVALEILRRVVMRTPVLSGRARGSWQTTVGAPMENHVPYIQRLEDGYSTQAPAGMVKITVAEFEGIVEAMGRAAQ